MKILDMACVKGFMRLAQDSVDKGWHEMNGGNLSYRMTEAEAANVKKVCKKPTTGWIEIGGTVPKLGGQFFVVTGTTRFMRNVMRDPENAFGIAEIDATGTKYRIWWGLANGGRPTSEFAPHLRCHEIRMTLTDGANRVIYHCHPPAVIALTFVLPLTDKAFTRVLWSAMTECPVIFPEGVGVVKWMVPGKDDIARATQKLMAKYRVVIWAHHGLFCAGATFDQAFGMMETVVKSADIALKVMSTGRKVRQTITSADIRKIAKDFKLKVNEAFLD
jgi:rhamnulose-1-phosphate aldolase